MPSDLLFRLQALLKRTAVDRDIDDELRFHIERQIESYKKAGIGDAEATRRARLEFGGVDQTKDEYRDAPGVRMLDDLRRDVRLAVRSLAATPMLSVIAGLSLALGIGANTAIFSIANSLLLRPLPVERPDRLVLLLSSSNPSVTISAPWSNPAWEQIRDHHADLFETTFAFSRRTTRFNLAQGGRTDFVNGIYASAQYFDALRVSPMLGRLFTAEDDRRGGGPNGPVAVISYALWEGRFGGSPDIIGKVHTIDRVPFTIVGVMPPDFFGTDVGTRADLILPLGSESLIRGRDSMLDRVATSSLFVMARLKDGQTVGSAEQAFRGVQAHIREATLPANARAETLKRYLATPFGVQAAAGGPSAMRGRYRQPVLAILTVVALVLLIACANIANLFLARAARRRHEFSVRRALGASRWRLARQQLVESLLLSAVGGIAGLGIARWGSGLLVRQLSTQANTVFLDTRLDWQVLAFTASVAVGVALLFGIAPAFRASRTKPIDALREHGRGTVGTRGVDVGAALVAGQVALSLVLVVAAGLFIRTFTTLATQNVGFDRDPVLLVRVDPPPKIEPSQRAALYAEVAVAIRAMPGVAHAAVSEVTPVSGMITDVYVEAENGPPLTTPQSVAYKNLITPDWFATYGTRLVAGRDFDDRDRLSSPPVAIVNETFARKFLQGGNALGRRIRNPSSAPDETSQPWMEVVGVVADATYLSLRDAVPATMYLPLAQQFSRLGFFPFATLSVRAAHGPPTMLARGIGAAIARVDPGIAITFTPLKQQVDAALVQDRIVALLSGFFGALALLLSAIGLYGVTAYAVAMRRTEIGIRMALGAVRSHVVSLVVARLAGLVGVGVIVGVAASLWLSRFVASLLYGLEPRDPVTLMAAIVVLVAVGVAAASLPAIRATRLDPAAVLREG